MITNYNNNNRNEQNIEVTLNKNETATMMTTNVNDDHKNQINIEKGEREKREDNLTTREQENERSSQTNKNTYSVTSFTSKLYNCPSVNDSMTNHIPLSFNMNTNHQTIPLLNNNFIQNTKSSRSHRNKTHYLDDSDEEIIKDEILEITNIDHYPTLFERWGDDTKIHIKQQGNLKIEDYIEFQEIEPTIFEEISYEINYINNQIQSTKQIHYSRSESRNFLKIKKRRTKIKRPKQNNILSNYNNNTTSINEIKPSIFNNQFLSSSSSSSIDQYSTDNNHKLESINSNMTKDNEIPLVSNSSTILTSTHLSLENSKPEAIYIDKEKDEKLITKIDIESKPELIEKTDTTKNQPIITNSIIQTAETIIPINQQPSILLNNQENENIHHSSDSLVDIIRQIITKTPSTHLPLIDQTKQITIKSTDDSLTEQSNIQTISTRNIDETKPINNIDETKPINNIIQKTTTEYPLSNSQIESIPSTIENQTDDITSSLNSSFKLPNTIDTSLDSINIDDEQIDEKKLQSNLTKIYYELQEQRQIPSIIKNIDIDESDNNKNNSIEYFQSFSLISNLPSREYHQVFGVSNNIVNTHNNQKSSSNILPDENSQTNEIYNKLNSQYSLLLNRIDILLKPLINLSSTNEVSIPSITDNQQQSSTLLSKTSVDDNILSTSTINSNDNQQQEFTETKNEIVNNTNENIIPQQQPVISNCPWYLQRYEISPTEFIRLSPHHQSSTIDNKQFQIIYDDYPWYSNHYTIIDAETKFERLYKQLNLTNIQPIVQSQNKLSDSITTQNQNLHDQLYDNEDDFHIVKHRKRIPSSTTNDKILPSINIPTKLILSPDIDLTPVILHGHSNTSNIISPIIPQHIDTDNKKKQKKKKKTKQDMILFDAPEPILSNKNEIIPSSIIDEHQENIQSSPKSLSSSNKIINPSLNIIENEEDTEGFQLVNYRKGILSTIKPKQISNTDDSTTSTNNLTQDTISKKKTNKHKKHKQETNLSSNINWTNIEQQTISSPSINQPSNIPTKPILSTSKNTTKPSITSQDKQEKEEEDNEGYQVVSYRKHTPSTLKSEKISSTKTTNKQNINRNNEPKFALSHEHNESTLRSIHPKTLPIKTSSNKNQSSSINTPSQSTLTNTDNISELPKNIIEETKQLQSTLNQSQQQLKDTKQSSNQIITENPISTKNNIKTQDQQSSINDDDNDGFQVVHYRKRILSSTTSPTSKQTNPIPPINQKLPDTYTKNHSSTITNIPIKENKIKQNIQLPLTPDTDSIPLSIEETIHHISKSVNQTDATTQNHLQSTNTDEDISTSSNEFSTSESNKFSLLSQTLSSSSSIDIPSTSIESTINIEDKPSNEIINSNKKSEKRRKKKLNSSISPIHTNDNTENISESNEQLMNSNNETNTKLDLFLPEYIREQISTSDINNSNSNNNQKKKQRRHKMLKKDSEAKSLLTNEFENQQSNISNEKTIDNILTRGFHLWLQESQALSTQNSSIENDIPIPIINISTEKQIHIINGYLINHPKSKSIK